MFNNIGFHEIDDFRTYKASAEAIALAESFIAEGKKADREFLENHKTIKPKLPITGSFIYAHPPNYRGRPTLGYNVSDWIQLFKELKSDGIELVLFQAAAWLELEAVFYPSSIFKNFKSWNVIEPMLEAAETEKITVFMGGMGSATGWKEIFEKNTVDEERSLHIKCYKELIKNYGKSFHGFYFAPETIYMGKRDKTWELTMNNLYREILSEIKSAAPGKPILMSPGTRYYEGRDEEFCQSWLTLLKNVPLDIMAPQDSIGTCMSNLQVADKTYSLWKKMCDEAKIKFWSNIEIFERKDKIIREENNYSTTADYKKVYAQIEVAEKYAEKLICWEAPYYLSEEFSGRAAAELKAKLLAINKSLIPA